MQTFLPQPRSPAQLAIIGAILWVVGALIHLALLAPIGIALLIVAGVGQLMRPRSRDMYWRGRRIQLDDNSSPRIESTELYSASDRLRDRGSDAQRVS